MRSGSILNFSKEKISKEKMKKKDKWEAYDVKKQTICIVPQSNESSARHSPEPTWGKPFIHF